MATRVTFPAWQGWIRAGTGFPVGLRKADNGNVELGAASFCLPDPAEARDTTWLEAGGQFCVFTGHLYNPGELVKELNLNAETPASPARLVLESYRRWGRRWVDKVEGVFASAIWDEPNQTLLCAHDAVGLHPFYYSQTGAELLFSWDLHALVRHPRVSRELSRLVLAEHLTHHLLDPHLTFFSAVRRLPRGHALQLQRGRLEVFRFWDPVPSSHRWATRDEMEQFPGLLHKAVESVMAAGNGRTGIFLSGGLDSVSVATCAVPIAARRGWPLPLALSAAFPDETFEQPIQEAVARDLGLTQTFVHVREYCKGPGLLRGALAVTPISPSPPQFVFAPPFLDLLQEAKSAGCEVVLTGDGGDELLAASPSCAADLILSGRFIELYRQLSTLGRFWEAPVLRAVRYMLWTLGVRTILREWAWKYAPTLALRRRRQLLPKAFPHWAISDPALRREVLARYVEAERVCEEDSFYTAYNNKYLLDPSIGMVCEQQFYRNKEVGIPTLHPYWHRPLANFLFRMPPELLEDGRKTKSLARRLVAARFPDLGFDKQKKVVAVDFAKEILQKELPGLWRYLDRARCMADLGLVDPGPYHAMLERYSQSDKGRHLYQVWHGGTIEEWIRCHG